MIPSFFSPGEARRLLPTTKQLPKSRRCPGIIKGKWRSNVLTSGDVRPFVQSILQRLPLPSDKGQLWALVSGSLISTGQLNQQFHRDSFGRGLLQLLLYLDDCPALSVIPGRHCYPIEYSDTLNSDAPSAADIRGTMIHHV
jgi:hypothetical protein